MPARNDRTDAPAAVRRVIVSPAPTVATSFGVAAEPGTARARAPTTAAVAVAASKRTIRAMRLTPLSEGTFRWREPAGPKNLREGNPVVAHLGYTGEGSIRGGVELSSLERTIEPQDRAADELADLYRDHGRLVAGICRGMLRDPEEAADAAQQTFLAAHRSLLAGTRPQEPAAWLATIARNECRMRIRKRMTAPLTVALDPELDGRGDTTHQEIGRAH